MDANRSTQFSTGVWNSKLSCKCYSAKRPSICTDFGSETSPQQTRAEGYDRRSAAACLPLTQGRSRKINWSFVYYNRIIVGASCLLAATLICRLKGDNRSGRLCFTCANQLLCSEPGTIDSPAFSSKDGSRNPSEALPQNHKCFKHVLRMNTLYCEARAKIIKNHLSSRSDNPIVSVCLANCQTMHIRIH